MKAARTFALMLLTALVAAACNPSSITAPQDDNGRNPVIGGSGG
jgi:hypothetical protein